MTDPLRTRSPLRLLVLAPNWLGDVVMTTPLLSFLHAHRTPVREITGRDLRICLGIRPAWAALFRNDPRVDELVVLERGGRHGGARGVIRLAGTLKASGYEAVLLGPPSLRSALVAWWARIPGRIGYGSDGRSPLLTHCLPSLERGKRHYSGEMIELGSAWLESLGVQDPSCPEADRMSSLPGCAALAAAESSLAQPVWAIAPGTTYGEAKTWPVARLGEFIGLAVGSCGARVVFLGDDAARGFTSRLKEGFPGDWSDGLDQPGNLIDMTGKTDLNAAVRILKASRVFIGNDSGLMHLAAALGIPTVGIFGSSNPDWTAPLGDRTRAVFPAGFDCRPCYRKTCNQETFCLETVSADTVLRAVLEIAPEARNIPGGA